MSKASVTEQAPPSGLYAYKKVRDFYTDREFATPVSQIQDRYVKDKVSFVEQRFDANSAISGMFGSSETTIIQKLNYSVCQQLEKLMIRLNVTVSSSTTELAPVPYWFKRIEIFNASGNKMQVIHPEETVFKLNQISKEYARNALKEICHFGESGVSWRSPSAVNQMMSGETRDFFLPIMSVVDQAGLNFKYLKDWVEFRFVTRGDIRESGSGTVSVNYINFVIQDRNLDEDTKKYYEAYVDTSLKRHYYLDCTRFSHVTNTALTSGSDYIVNLSAIPQCFSPFILVSMRQSSTVDDAVTAGAMQAYIPVGPGGKIMLKDGSNNIMEVSGNVNVDLLYRTLSQQYAEGDLLQIMPLYLMSFANSVEGPLAGRWTNGYYAFNGTSNQSLVINAVSGTSAVQTITSAATASLNGGNYRLSYLGHITGNLAYNETASNIKAALEGLPSFKAENLTVTVTQPFSTAGTLVLTFAARCGNPKALVQCIPDSVNSTGVFANPVTSLTTRGIAGIVNSQTHVIDIFVFYYKELYSIKGILGDNKIYNV